MSEQYKMGEEAPKTLEIKKRKLHGYHYTPLEQAQKESVLSQVANDPSIGENVPSLWKEWLYDYIYKEIGEDEFNRRIESGYYE